MAQQRNHLSVSVLLSAAYAGAGLLIWGFPAEQILLAAVLVVITGLLPNIDSGPESDTGRNFLGFIAAVTPLVLLASFPQLRSGGIARLALVLIASFILSRMIMGWILTKLHRRGLLHSIPASIIIFEVGYLLFWDLPSRDRLYLAGAAFVGFISHLLLDATTNIDLVGNREKKAPVLKLAGPSWGSTLALYTTMTVLGWFVLQDIYPGLRVYGGVRY